MQQVDEETTIIDRINSDSQSLADVILVRMWMECELRWKKHKLENQLVETEDGDTYFPSFAEGLRLRAYRKVFGVTGQDLLERLQITD